MLRGEGFGGSAAELGSIAIGGTECGATTWVSPSEVRCDAVEGSSFEDSTVQVRLRGTVAEPPPEVPMLESERTDGVLLLLPPPVAVGALPSRIDTAGNTTVDLAVCNSSGILRAWIGDALAWNASAPEVDLVRIAAPAGVGASARVRLDWATGLSSFSREGLVRYAPPLVHSVEASPSPVGSVEGQAYEVRVRGKHFGPHDAEADVQVRVGGKDCPRVERVNDTLVVCRGVAPPWSSREVELSVGDQTGSNPIAFSF